MNDETKSKLAFASTAAGKLAPWIAFALFLVAVTASASVVATSRKTYVESMDALEAMADAGTVPPEIIDAIHGLGGILAGAIMIFAFVFFLLKYRRRL